MGTYRGSEVMTTLARQHWSVCQSECPWLSFDSYTGRVWNRFHRRNVIRALNSILVFPPYKRLMVSDKDQYLFHKLCTASCCWQVQPSRMAAPFPNSAVARPCLGVNSHKSFVAALKRSHSSGRDRTPLLCHSVIHA